MTTPHIRIGTRASQLAQWQAHWVAGQLRSLGATVEIVEITTQGDVQQRGPIAAIGLQGVFTKEIQTAVLAGDVDVAVHSLKDLPTQVVDGLTIAAVPLRESPADALVTHQAASLVDLPPRARIGTGSLRRQAQLKYLRPDIEVVGIRGNVDTRLRKLHDGEYDAIVLACSGLRRLGLQKYITELLEPPRMLPAPGQGALAVECRADASAVRVFVGRLNDLGSRQAIDSERSMLALLHGGCSAPVGAWARFEGEQLRLDGLVADLEGVRVIKASASGDAATAEAIGAQVAKQLLQQGAGEIIAAARLPS